MHVYSVRTVQDIGAVDKNNQRERDYYSTNLSILNKVIETCFEMLKSSEPVKNYDVTQVIDLSDCSEVF